MRPVHQLPLSLSAMKRSPLALRRMPDSPPKPGKDEVSTSPLRYSSEPKRTCEWSCGSKSGIGRALTSIEAGALTECSATAVDLAGGRVVDCARPRSGPNTTENPAADISRKRRREKVAGIYLRMQPAWPRGR